MNAGSARIVTERSLWCTLKMMNFAIVEFIEDRSVAVVPINWLSSEDSERNALCQWPPKSRAVEKLAREQALPNEKWTAFGVRVLHKYGIISCYAYILTVEM